MEDGIVIEGMVATIGPDGTPHVAAMGPYVDGADPKRLVLRPFLPSSTWDNLRANGRGVFHITDDVLCLARLVMRTHIPAVEWHEMGDQRFPVVANVCRWLPFEAREYSVPGKRAWIECRVLATFDERPYIGLHRARHAVLEAAILATRTGILPAAEILRKLEQVRPWVEKTGGRDERTAFAELESHIRRRLSGA